MIPFLTPGARIGVMAPSSHVDPEAIEKSAAVVRARGFEIFIHPQTYERQGQSAGIVLQKSLALQGLLQRSDIDAIWFAGGGNQGMELLRSLNFETIHKNAAKPVIGFSDNTSLLNALNAHCGSVHFHAPVFKFIHETPQDHLDACFDVLTGAVREIKFKDTDFMRGGAATGRLTGGNLSLFQYMPALLPSDYMDGAILFLEDCNEELSRIDRMFCFLKLQGVFEKISGLVLGQFTDLTDGGRPFEMDLEGIVRSHIVDYSFPVVMNAPFGHGDEKFFPLPVGAMATIDSETLTLRW